MLAAVLSQNTYKHDITSHTWLTVMGSCEMMLILHKLMHLFLLDFHHLAYTGNWACQECLLLKLIWKFSGNWVNEMFALKRASYSYLLKFENCILKGRKYLTDSLICVNTLCSFVLHSELSTRAVVIIVLHWKHMFKLHLRKEGMWEEG